MNKFFKHSLILMSLSGFLFLNSCKDDPALPENLTAFEADQLGIASSESELNVNLTLAREATSDGSVTILIEPIGLTYGTDFTTDPAATSNQLILSVPTGSTSVSFKLKKVASALYDGDETIKFTIQSIDESLVVGLKNQLNVAFAELLASSGTMEINGGGATYPNKVFIDFSANRQTAVARNAWDLGFSTTDDFRVILNASNGMLARVIDKTNLNDVKAADTIGFGAQLSVNAIFALAASAEDPSALPDWVKNSTAWIDNPAGDLTKTAITAVSATASENKVYIINRGGTLGWKKIRIVRNGSNYTLQHADIGATNFAEIQVVKDPAYRFQSVSFASGVVNLEPQKDKWDIAWTASTNTTNFGPGTPTIPYYFQDLVVQNLAGVETYTYTTNTTNTLTFETFAEANLAGITWSTNQINIGSSWRTTGGPPPSPAAGVNATRFYIIKDSDGNYYKVKFTALTTNGERGKPQLQFALVKKGA